MISKLDTESLFSSWVYSIFYISSDSDPASLSSILAKLR